MYSIKRFEIFLSLTLVLGSVACSAGAHVSKEREDVQAHFSTVRETPRGIESLKQWTSDARLTFDPGASLLSFNFAWSIAADDSGRVHVVWHDDRDGSPQIYYRRSIDNGTTWERETRLSRDSARKEHPAIAVSGKNIYAVWHDTRGGSLNIYFKRSTDGGVTWEADTRLTSSGKSAHASIAVTGSSVHVVWGDHRDGEQAEIYTRHSSDAGTTWGEETRLSDVPYDSWVSTVTATGNNVYVAWVDTRDGNEEEYFRRSTDGGLSWKPAIRITNNSANSWAPSIAVSGKTVHLVWFDQQDNPIQPLDAEKKLDEAMNLVGLKVDPAPSGVMVAHPEGAAKRRAMEKGQQLQRAAPGWIQQGGDAARLGAILEELEEMGKRGTSYSTKERKLDDAMRLIGMAYTPGSQQDVPKIYYTEAMGMRVRDKVERIMAAGPGWVQRGGDPKELEGMLKEFERLMWSGTMEWDTYYRSSKDGGATWGPIVRLTNAPGPSQRPSIAVSGNDLHIVWFDARQGNSEIYSKHSLDGGTTWGPDQRLTDAPGDSMHPTVAVSTNSVHVVWFDRRDGNAEIYYKRAQRRGRRQLGGNSQF